MVSLEPSEIFAQACLVSRAMNRMPSLPLTPANKGLSLLRRSPFGFTRYNPGGSYDQTHASSPSPNGYRSPVIEIGAAQVPFLTMTDGVCCLLHPAFNASRIIKLRKRPNKRIGRFLVSEGQD